MSASQQASVPALPGSGARPEAAPKSAPRTSLPSRRWLWRLLRWTLFAALAAAAALAISRYARTQAAPVVRYQSAPVDRGPIAAKVTASGTVSAITTVLVGSQVSGRVEHWYVDFNAPVKKGQLIATIEPSLFRAAVEQANANYASTKAAYAKAVAGRLLADRNYARELALYAENLAARVDLDAAEAQAGSARADIAAADAAMLQAQAALAQATLNYSYTQIHSPIDGVVISRNVDVGQTVAASFQAPTLFTIAQDLTKMQVDTNVAEGDVGKVREKMEATFTVDAYPGRIFRGQVRQVRDNAQTLQNVVTYDAVIDVDNSDRTLRPTMTANCTFVYATRDSATRIPNGALRFKPDAATVAAMTFGQPAPPPPARDGLSTDQRRVWITRGGGPMPRVIRIGVSDGMVTEVTEGDVNPGDVAITEAIAPATSGH